MTDLTGRTIGQYQLIEQKSETASSVLCKAFQPALDRYVALKILKPSSSRQPDEAHRFRQQGELNAQFSHPRLVEVYETGEANGLLYRAMRLAENGSLRDQLALGLQSPFYAPQRAQQLLEEIIEGLEQIYAQGYINGNINPGNILLDGMLRPLLSDFGLPAKIGGAVSPYLAPEQVQGGMVDRRTDIYALGVLLFTMLVGSEPPAGVVVSPRSRRPELPEALERVVLKSMAQNPDQRFQSAAEFSEALRAALTAPIPAAQPVYVPPPAAPAIPMQTISQTVTVESEKKGPSVIAILIGVVFILILCIGALYSYRNLSDTQGTVTAAPTQVAGQPTQAPPIIIMPTQPPPVTEVMPTREQRPTQPPQEQPTQPPQEQPTQPPQEQPTQPPQEQPTLAPEVEQPIAPPNEGAPGTGLLPCGSAALVLLPMVVLGAHRWKKRDRELD